MKKLFSLIITLIIIFCAAIPVFAAGFTPPFDINAQSAYMVNVDTGLVLYEKGADDKRSVASLTKLMTTLLLMEAVPASEMDTTEMTAPSSWKAPVLGAAGADIWSYENVTVTALMHAMLLPSANEAANVVALSLGGGNLQNFYAMMNARAKQLGCKNTNFASEHGLDDMDKGNYSSARDMYLIFSECLKHEVFKEITAKQTYQMPATNKHATPYNLMPSTNRMMSKTASVYREYIKSGKTGSTHAAGRNFASLATKDGHTYITIVLNAPYEPHPESGYALSFHDTANLLDWAFKDFSVRPCLDPTSPINEVEVKYSSETDVLKLYPAEELRTILPNGSDETVLQKKFEIPEYVESPIKQGDVVGSVTLVLAGETIGKVNLLAGQDVERNFTLYALAQFINFITGLYFKVVIVVCIITFIGYAIVATMHNKKNKSTRNARRPRL